jgi:hypothetical protein
MSDAVGSFGGLDLRRRRRYLLSLLSHEFGGVAGHRLADDPKKNISWTCEIARRFAPL